MTDPEQPPDASAAMLAALQTPHPQMLLLRLYVAGASRRSTDTISTLLAICEQHFANHYQLEILDVYQHTERAYADAILATPTLLLIAPASGRYFIGDLRQTDRLLAALGISTTEP